MPRQPSLYDAPFVEIPPAVEPNIPENKDDRDSPSAEYPERHYPPGGESIPYQRGRA